MRHIRDTSKDIEMTEKYLEMMADKTFHKTRLGSSKQYVVLGKLADEYPMVNVDGTTQSYNLEYLRKLIANTKKILTKLNEGKNGRC